MTTTTSGKFSLDSKDFLKGLLLAVITPVLTTIIASLEAGVITFNWKAIGITAVTTMLAYIMKNFFTPAQVVINNPTDKEIKMWKAAIQQRL